jgi:hypothetical protein
VCVCVCVCVCVLHWRKGRVYMFCMGTFGLSGSFDAHDEPVHGLWHHVGVSWIAIVL